ncbi:hypothetical protein PTSG_04097 [Salpingoeca rosetta]|uniref:RRM domain-containing protein n=1 Tax=Salpingoeca rosetta (strain ATCC 50818 / BSB-021) TaxID=946362 RepID=F2U6K7_SALR5|nr:uncharacterized protein PTSG_04097 [Salpingoeca rosetta]EGD83489.1 hypothetical protein PTSG_04097 [Salpingoeca rosetta]|eukprot:XP_004994993.1 hypothetical protein PTSG_04097 [Salpingoeca rosetta]
MSKVDMSLDALIEQDRAERQTRGRGRGGRRGRGRGRGASSSRPRTQDSRRRNAPYTSRSPRNQFYQHDSRAFAAPMSAPAPTPRSAKLLVENLDYGVTESDIEQLFGAIGQLVDYSIHYDRAGRSLGVAEVEFARSKDAAAAVEEYNGRYLDTKPMKVSFVGRPGDLVQRVPVPVPVPVSSGPRVPRSSRGGRTTRGRGAQRGRGSRGRGAANRREKKETPVSKDALDAQLDLYQTGKVSVDASDLDRQLDEYQQKQDQEAAAPAAEETAADGDAEPAAEE